MDQIERQFVPHVLAVRAGTEVSFPNSDQVRHHVYSFSSPKRFEIKLYKGTPSAPVRFDRPGLVVLGCNIHDQMLGYIYVAETPHFATTAADGAAHFSKLPAGSYEVRIWHPRLAGGDGPLQTASLPLSLEEGDEERAALELRLESFPEPDSEPLTPLERKLRERTGRAP